jgi:hypothetical protein
MNALKTLLAVSVLAGAGAANAAAVATFDATQTATSIVYHPAGDLQLILPGNPNSGAGTASLDDSGLLSVTIPSFHLITALGTDSFTGNSISINGSWDGTTFSAASASAQYTSCANGPTDGTNFTCSSVVLNSPLAFTASGTATLAGGLFTIVSTAAADPASTTTYEIALTNGVPVPSIPVPAAAWLFGSGLLGLAGTARRRSA